MRYPFGNNWYSEMVIIVTRGEGIPTVTFNVCMLQQVARDRISVKDAFSVEHAFTG